MDEPEALTRDELLAWQSLGRVAHALPRVLEEDMRRATRSTMTEYAVLLSLSSAPDSQMRMADLAAATGLSPSRMTRVVDAMQTQGLVVKVRDVADGRGNLATLTAEGRAGLEAGALTHVHSARRRFLDHIPPHQVAVVAQVLNQVAQALIEQQGEPTGADVVAD